MNQVQEKKTTSKQTDKFPETYSPSKHNFPSKPMHSFSKSPNQTFDPPRYAKSKNRDSRKTRYERYYPHIPFDDPLYDYYRDRYPAPNYDLNSRYFPDYPTKEFKRSFEEQYFQEGPPRFYRGQGFKRVKQTDPGNYKPRLEEGRFPKKRYEDSRIYKNDIFKDKSTGFVRGGILMEIEKVLDMIDFMNIFEQKNALKFSLEVKLRRGANGRIMTRVFFKNDESDLPSKKFDFDGDDNEFKIKRLTEDLLEMQKEDYLISNRIKEKTQKIQKMENQMKLNLNFKNKEFHFKDHIHFPQFKRIQEDNVQSNSNRSIKKNRIEESSFKKEVCSNKLVNISRLKENGVSSLNDSFEDVSLNNIRMRRKQRKLKAREIDIPKCPNI